MRDALPADGFDYLEFRAPDTDGNEAVFMVNQTFLTSNWNCIYGNGCGGLFGKNEKTYAPDTGCCSKGCWFTDGDDHDKTLKMAQRLSEADWDADRMAYAQKHGPTVTFSRADGIEKGDPDFINARTRTYKDACIFHNVADGSVGSTGKIGCAFHHMGEREGLTHVESMPEVCWSLPLRCKVDEDTGTTMLYPWSATEWGGQDKDGTHDSWMCWWCIDSPDAYTSDSMVYKTLEEEIRTLLGDAAYDEMVRLIELRLADRKTPPDNMPGAYINEGRPLLPLLIADKQPRRSSHV